MDTHRPPPAALLAAVQKEESRQQRGQLKIFFGMDAGVGKTHAMLDAAQGRRINLSGSWPAYLWSVLVVVICTLIAWAMFPYFAAANLIMVYLVGVLITAIRFGRGPSILAAVLSVAAFDFFYVVPYLTFAVSDTQYVITFAVMLLVGLTISNLAARVRQQAAAARQREKRTAALYAMSREFASTRGRSNLAQVAMRHVGQVFERRAAIFLPDANGRLATVGQNDFCQDANEQGVAQWVYDHRQLAGAGTETLPTAHALYLPLVTVQGAVGVLGVCLPHPHRFHPPEHVQLLETFAQQIALSLERAHLSEEAEQARIQVETEQLRNSLLSSVSHDLHTPLAAIMGAASTLLDNNGLDGAVRQELAEAIYEEANRLNRLVRNLLDMTRVESGSIQVKKNWQPLEEVVGAALSRLEGQLGERPVSIHLPADLPLVPLDEVLIEQVFVNLLENAVKYTPPGSPIDLSAWADDQQVTVEVADRGPGLPASERQRVFDKFFRVHSVNSSGVGLGLTICRGIIKAHGGSIWVENRPEGGATFRFTLPLAGQPPPLDPEDFEQQAVELGE
jgi:two-component system sensor histidine kinase KdpD